MNSWYVLHVKTGEETDVMHWVRKGIPTSKAIVPQRILREQKRGNWKTVIKTVFPGYVFVNTLMDAAVYYKLTGIPAVIKILGNDRGPMPVPEEEMQIVLRLAGDGDPLGISDIYIEGSRIKVKSGPMEGLEGNIVKVDARRFRAKVNISLMGEPRIVELAVNVLEKI